MMRLLRYSEMNWQIVAVNRQKSLIFPPLKTQHDQPGA